MLCLACFICEYKVNTHRGQREPECRGSWCWRGFSAAQSSSLGWCVPWWTTGLEAAATETDKSQLSHNSVQLQHGSQTPQRVHKCLNNSASTRISHYLIRVTDDAVSISYNYCSDLKCELTSLITHTSRAQDTRCFAGSSCAALVAPTSCHWLLHSGGMGKMSIT